MGERKIRNYLFSDLHEKREKVYVGSVLFVRYALSVLYLLNVFFVLCETYMQVKISAHLLNGALTMNLPADTVRRIEDAAAALIAAGNPNPTNDQVRAHLGGGSLSHISPVMREFRARQRALASEQTPALPTELAKLLTGQLTLLWQAAVKQAEAETLAAREQADADIAQADQERDEALARVAMLESKLSVLLGVEAERDRLLEDVRELRAEALPLHEQVARLTATGEHLAAQLQDTKVELKESRTENRTLQAELLTLARNDGKVKK